MRTRARARRACHQGHPAVATRELRGVAPGATHYRGGDALFPQDDVPQFMTPSPQVDYPLRMSVDETMSRLRLQGAGDLQTFIRYVRSHSFVVSVRIVVCVWYVVLIRPPVSPITGRIWTNTSERRIAWRSASGR